MVDFIGFGHRQQESPTADERHILQVFKVLSIHSSLAECLELARTGLDFEAANHVLVKNKHQERIEQLMKDSRFLEEVRLPGAFSTVVHPDIVDKLTPLQKTMLNKIQQSRDDIKTELVDVYWEQVRMHQYKRLIREHELLHDGDQQNVGPGGEGPNEHVLRTPSMVAFMQSFIAKLVWSS